MGLGPQRKDSKTFGTTVYGLTHPNKHPQLWIFDLKWGTDANPLNATHPFTWKGCNFWVVATWREYEILKIFL